jgi:hypothetical protein
VAESRSGKKVVRVEHTAAAEADDQAASHTRGGTTFAPSPEATRKAITFRIIAAVLWAIAIAAEAVDIFVVLKQNPVNMVLLIALIVVAGIAAVVGNILWKRANQADPASRDDPVRFFVQNQLGAIIAVIAFLPLVVMVLLNKNMSGGQKAVAAVIAIVALGAGVATGISVDPPSTQQYDQETAQVVAITGANVVYWTKSGKVYHLCQDASAVNQESKDNQIYSGTVGDAHAAGKTRLTLQVDQEEKQCGFTPQVSASATP